MLLYYFKPNPQGSTLTTQVMRCTVCLGRFFFFFYSIYGSHCKICTIHRFHCTIQLAFNFFFFFFFFTFLVKNFQFQLNKLFSNRPVVLGSFQNHLSHNNVEIFHQGQNLGTLYSVLFLRFLS